MELSYGTQPCKEMLSPCLQGRKLAFQQEKLSICTVHLLVPSLAPQQTSHVTLGPPCLSFRDAKRGCLQL